MFGDIHYLIPEKKWGVFINYSFVKAFDTHEEAVMFLDNLNFLPTSPLEAEKN